MDHLHGEETGGVPAVTRVLEYRYVTAGMACWNNSTRSMHGPQGKVARKTGSYDRKCPCFKTPGYRYRRTCLGRGRLPVA